MHIICYFVCKIKQSLLLKKYQIQIKFAIVDWVYQWQKCLKHVAAKGAQPYFC